MSMTPKQSGLTKMASPRAWSNTFQASCKCSPRHVRGARVCLVDLRSCSASPDRPACTSAQMRLEKLCSPKSARRCHAAVRTAANSGVSEWRAVANAHTKLARFYVLKPQSCRSAALAVVRNRDASDEPAS
eukprot:gnl/TRDRNA2_/TRDRNA2_171421_c0_seq7.p2 gnl/TRDRNA2_/TRDRNA2_171421_c0~~gnl/TRDRNA2_/TRDRNA2_171421_c0_seq7.p2  ORF type:complete len:131 (-),score=7.87 gnl/TRDRNA2_/TRDRNA2_171421_c0_seq7:130-522(-)